MAIGGKTKRPRRTRRKTEEPLLPAVAPEADGLVQALDELRATVIALLASLRVKELDLRERAGAHPAPGILAGLNDIGAIRLWADRTLRTIEVLSHGQTGELGRLLEELGEFRELVDSTVPPPPPSE
jgi:hypothetical protein